MDADYVDDMALLAGIPAQAGTVLHSLEQAAGGIGLHINLNKTESICFNQRGHISTPKLVDKFTYPGSGVSSTETDISMWLANAWTGIDKLSAI